MEILGNALMSYDAYGRPRRRVGITVDAKTRTIVVAGDPKELQALQNATAIIEQLDSALGAQAERRIKVVALKQGKAAELSPKVRQLYNDQLSAQPDLGTTDILIMEDTPANQLILAGSEAQLKLIERIIGELQSSVVNQGARETRIFDVGRAEEVTRLQPLVQQLYSDRWKSKDAGDPPDAQIVADGPNGRLVATGRTNHLAEIGAIVELLKGAGAAQRDVHVVHLKKSRADTVAEALNSALTNRLGGALAQGVSVTPVSGANSLLIHGPTNAIDGVMKIVRELDNEGDAGDIEVRSYRLENGTAKEVSSVLEQILDNVSRYQSRTRTGRFIPASVSANERANSLLVSGTPAHFRTVEKILPTLDKAPERSDRDVQFIWLKKAKAYDVASKVEAVFTGRDEKEKPVIEADGFNNSLTVIARRGDMVQIQDLISRLDEQSKDTSLQVRLRPLDRVTADQMARMLQNIYPQMAQGQVRVVEKVEAPKAVAPAQPAAAEPPRAK
jgi:type II secretory pathway component GspD/PulD (secretin)